MSNDEKKRTKLIHYTEEQNCCSSGSLRIAYSVKLKSSVSDPDSFKRILVQHSSLIQIQNFENNLHSKISFYFFDQKLQFNYS